MNMNETSALLLAFAAALGVACSTGNRDSSSEAVTVTPAQAAAAAAATPGQVSITRERASEAQEQAADRAAFESGRAAEGEAFLQPVTPELERELEAGYQESLRQRLQEKAVLGQPHDAQ